MVASHSCDLFQIIISFYCVFGADDTSILFAQIDQFGHEGSLDFVEKNALATGVSRLFSVRLITIANLPDLSLTKVLRVDAEGLESRQLEKGFQSAHDC